MLSALTLFLVLFASWALLLLPFNSLFNVVFLTLGFITSGIIAFVSWKLKIISTVNSFMFLQVGFYKYIFKKVNENIFNAFALAFEFINPNHEFKPILDYVLFNRDDVAETALCANLLNILPGTLAIVLKKRYIIVHSLSTRYLGSSDMFVITEEIPTINDDSLI